MTSTIGITVKNSKQELALCGHRVSPSSVNIGNYLEVISVVAKHDTIVQRRLSEGPKNASYTSAKI